MKRVSELMNENKKSANNLALISYTLMVILINMIRFCSCQSNTNRVLHIAFQLLNFITTIHNLVICWKVIFLIQITLLASIQLQQFTFAHLSIAFAPYYLLWSCISIFDMTSHAMPKRAHKTFCHSIY
jgi:hypothetical protein